MKILIISSLDIKTPKSWSGTLYYIYQALLKSGHDIVILEPQTSFCRIFLKVINRLFNLFGKKINHEHSIFVSKELGLKIRKKIEQMDFDVVFAPGASTEVAYLNSDKPIIYLSDTTFPLMVNYYDEFSRYNRIGIQSGWAIESKAINNSALATFPSSWACESAKLLSKKPDNIYQCKWGANLDYVCKDSLMLEKKLSEHNCNLLFVGVDWERKGGDIAVEVVSRLRKKGVCASLTVVGIEILDQSILDLPFVNNVGRLDKSDEKQLAKLKHIFSQSHFLILPTLGECYGMVFAEASAYGTPCLANRTGGVPSVVTEGINGHTVKNNSIEDYYNLILMYVSNPNKYGELVLSSRKIYEESLNWDKWVSKINIKISEIVDE